ncbi:unnamed protein product [Alopecurus aequalis]
MEPEPRRWAATYTTQLKKKRKAYHDGALLFYPDSRRLVLLDDAGVTIDAKFLRASDSVSFGASIEFPCHLVDVGEAQRGPTGHSGRSSEPAASRTAYRGGARSRQSAPHTSAPRAFVNPPKSGGGKAEAAGSGCAKSADSTSQEWHAMYTTQMTQKAKKFHDGFVKLKQMGSHSKQIILMNEEGETLGTRYLKSGECLETGKKCTFPNYLIEIGEAKTLNKGGERNSSEEPTGQTRPTRVGNASNKVGIGATNSLKFISPQKFHNLDESQSEVTSSCNKPELGKSEAVAAGSIGSLMEWRVLYTAQLTQKAKKYHDGVIRLMQTGPHVQQIFLVDEEGVVLGSRYFKSGETIESGTRCQFPNYLIEVSELRNQKNEPKHTSGEALNHTGPTNGENTSEKTGDIPKFVSPLKFNDDQNSKTKGTIGPNRPQVGKSTRSDMGDPLNFHAFTDSQRGKPDSTVGYRRTDPDNSKYSDINDPHKFNDFADFHGSEPEFSTSYSRLEVGKSTFSSQGKSTFGGMDDPQKFSDFTDVQRGKSGFPTSYNQPEVGKSTRLDDSQEFNDLQDGKSLWSTSSVGREVGKSTFGSTDDSLRTASQILSIMKPPAGLSHFATQLRTSVQSCLKLDTVHAKNSVSTHRNESSGNACPTYDHQAIMKPAAFDGPELAVVDIPASEMSNANEQKREPSGNLLTGNSTSTGSAPVSNDTSIPGLQEDNTGIVDQLGANNTAVGPNCGGISFPAPSSRRCIDPKIQDLIDDCPSFDLGF